MRRRIPALLAVAFVVVPILEIFVLIQVGRVIGAWWTVLLLIADSVLGAWLVKREWRGAWRALDESIRAGRLPSRELADAALIVVGGTLLLTPGFVSDVFGFFALLPVTRPIARRALLAYATRRLTGSFTFFGRSGRPPGRVVPGEVLDQDPGD
jgi:UPF0716 protein FxsA